MSVKRSSTAAFSGLRGRNGASVALATSDLNAVGLAIVLALVAALSGTRRGLLVPGLRISEVLAIGLILYLILHGKSRLVRGPVAAGLVCYALVTVVVTALHMMTDASLGNATIVTSALGPSALLTMYAAAAMARASSDLLKPFVKYLMVCAAGMGVLGILQMLSVGYVLKATSYLTGSQRILEPLNWKVSRSIGLFNSWHAYASFMAITLIVAIAVTASGVLVFRSMRGQLAVMLLILIGLLSSVTFAMIGAVGIVGGYILLRRGRVILVVLASFVTAITVGWSPLSPYFSERVAEQEAGGGDSILPQTVAFRIEVWTRDYLPLFYCLSQT